ncbi:hypothetical protein Pfo_012221 [Paulownia fortunei]|nr:hypothetical protein Pfo_012221 [Paulownia fortunei]
MADAIVSVVVERLAPIIEGKIRNEINLVRGVKKEVRNLSRELESVRNVLDEADRRGFKEKSVKDWLKRLEDMTYEMDDVLDEWNIAILKLQMEQSNAAVAPKHKVCSFIPSSCLCFKKVAIRRDIAKKIKQVKAQLDLILEEKKRYDFVTSQPTDPSRESWRVQSTSLIDLAEVHGRDSDSDILVSKLVPKGGSQEELGLHILSVVGVGGLGKTTLAQLVYNDSRVKECFELRIWICVSDPFDVAGIAKGIVESVKKGSSPDPNQLEKLLQCLIDSLSGKKFLLVLDDVWTEDSAKWEPLKNSLKCGGAGSKILVTTRNERVARMMGTIENEIHRLGQLSNEDCWLLLSRIALFGRNKEECEKFQVIGKNIANKCRGLPLAAKALGSLLRFKNTLEEWENVLHSEIWELEEAQVQLFPHLLLSYNELSPVLKRCFSYCAIFPQDFVIDVEDLIRHWMALGYLGSNGRMELRGREYFNNLAMRSLFQDLRRKRDLDEQIKWCKMHDIVHDFAQFLRKNTSNGEAGMKKTTCQACNPLLVSRVREYRSLFRDGETPLHCCDCLTSLRVFDLRLYRWQGIPQKIENWIHLRLLDATHTGLSGEDTQTICKLYNLQTLLLGFGNLEEIPREIGNLIHLRHLNLTWNKSLKELPDSICGLHELQTLLLSCCNLKEIPREIGNLIHLRHLDLTWNRSLKELPDSICGLHELRTLNVDHCTSLSGLPQGIHRLINLQELQNELTLSLRQYPQGLAQLTGLHTLSEFSGGRDWGKLGWLKNLNRLSGSLVLRIRLSSDDLEDVVEDAREAELRKKTHIKLLTIAEVSMDVIDALEPHPNLGRLSIRYYKGSKLKFPDWIALNQLRFIQLSSFNHLSSLLPLGKLPCLEEIEISGMPVLQFVGREFLGLTTTTTTTGVAAGTIGFPKLRNLSFFDCPKWKEWEDITDEEEDSAAVSLMPCLRMLIIKRCTGLTSLPHRLLRKASSLEELRIQGSTQLKQRYGDKEGSPWKSISQINPRLRLV